MWSLSGRIDIVSYYGGTKRSCREFVLKDGASNVTRKVSAINNIWRVRGDDAFNRPSDRSHHEFSTLRNVPSDHGRINPKEV